MGRDPYLVMMRGNPDAAFTEIYEECTRKKEVCHAVFQVVLDSNSDEEQTIATADQITVTAAKLQCTDNGRYVRLEHYKHELNSSLITKEGLRHIVIISYSRERVLMKS